MYMLQYIKKNNSNFCFNMIIFAKILNHSNIMNKEEEKKTFSNISYFQTQTNTR